MDQEFTGLPSGPLGVIVSYLDDESLQDLYLTYGDELNNRELLHYLSVDKEYTKALESIDDYINLLRYKRIGTIPHMYVDEELLLLLKYGLIDTSDGRLLFRIVLKSPIVEYIITHDLLYEDNETTKNYFDYELVRQGKKDPQDVDPVIKLILDIEQGVYSDGKHHEFDPDVNNIYESEISIWSRPESYTLDTIEYLTYLCGYHGVDAEISGYDMNETDRIQGMVEAGKIYDAMQLDSFKDNIHMIQFTNFDNITLDAYKIMFESGVIQMFLSLSRCELLKHLLRLNEKHVISIAIQLHNMDRLPELMLLLDVFPNHKQDIVNVLFHQYKSSGEVPARCFMWLNTQKPEEFTLINF